MTEFFDDLNKMSDEELIAISNSKIPYLLSAKSTTTRQDIIIEAKAILHKRQKKEMTDAELEKEDLMNWDLFICHASEDKDAFVRPLAEALQNAGLRVWYDEFSLTLGDRLRRSIDMGLKESRFGVVVLSHSFFDKHWPQLELDGLVQREVNGEKVILPIWHNVKREDVARFSPVLADRIAVESSRGTEAVVNEVMRAVHDIQSIPQLSLLYRHRIPVNYQGQLAIRVGDMVDIKSWFGPDGPGGSGFLRVCKMTNLTEQTEYTSLDFHGQLFT